jgi:lysozyme family protein
MSAFDQAFAIVVGHEGGYVNNPADPGGETKYGISKRSYPDLDIANLTETDAEAIYKRDYWDKLSLDIADAGLALVAFDAAVNNGVGAAIKWLQGALGVTPDGVIGPQTLSALAACAGDKAQAALVGMHASRINMMANLDTWKTFGGGWSKRLAQIPFQAAIMGGASGQADNPTA